MNPRLRWGLEAAFFILISLSFIRNAAQGGFFALGAGAACLLRGGMVAAYAVRGPENAPRNFRGIATALLFIGGLILVVGSAYSLFVVGTSAPVIHGALGVLGVGLLSYGLFEARGLKGAAPVRNLH
ncbi:MAG TPA: hypothetical protein VNZ52_01210 [Candidatus Thermoplasmatota archaeon]|nr:hypothetical protein [Candidatus Thermoplasmatota archaeon]